MSHVSMQSREESVRVIARVRPLTDVELDGGFRSCIRRVSCQQASIELANQKSRSEESKVFTFDAVYDEGSRQSDLYESSFAPIVESVLAGFNGTIFAYGQTGAGKTFTMEGDICSPDAFGVIPRSFRHIYGHISQAKKDEQYLARVSYLEIYQEEVRDLLSTGKQKQGRLEITDGADNGICIKDLSSFVCKSESEMFNVMKLGNANRHIGMTAMNEKSSRSHAIFIVTIECQSANDEQLGNGVRVGKLNLVDLAGSERQSKSQATGVRLREATRINLALSALGNVISALSNEHSTYIPYRDSKLTRILKDSLGGNSKTVMVANVGPAYFNHDETLSTLRYASRAKFIKNTPVINENSKHSLIREYKKEIDRLRSELQTRQNIPADASDSNGNQVSESIDFDSESQLLSQIGALQSKFLTGNSEESISSMFDHNTDVLAEQTAKLATMQAEECNVIEELKDIESEGRELARSCSNLHDRVDAKEKKTHILLAKLQSCRRELDDVQDEFSRDRRDIMATQSSMLTELKLKMLIISCFVRTEDKDRLLARSRFDEQSDSWILTTPGLTPVNTISVRPVSAIGIRRPSSQYARGVIVSQTKSSGGKGEGGSYQHDNLVATEERVGLCGVGLVNRRCGENVLCLRPDRGANTTKDYTDPVITADTQAALDDALRVEYESDRDISIDASVLRGVPEIVPKFNRISSRVAKPNISRARRNLKSASTMQREYSSRRRSVPDNSLKSPVNGYPSSRGLVLQ